MIENNDLTNKEQLTDVAGGIDSNSNINDEVLYLLRISLSIFKTYFTPEDEEQYFDVKRLHRCIDDALANDDHSNRKFLVDTALLTIDLLFELKIASFHAALIQIQSRLLQAQEILSK